MWTYLTKQKLPLTAFHQQRETNLAHSHDHPKNIGFWIARECSGDNVYVYKFKHSGYFVW